MSAAAMAAASLHGTLGQVVVTVLVTVAVYWAAERYARVLAVAARENFHRIGPVLRRGWPMVESAYAPLVVLVAIEFFTDDLRAGVLVALGMSAVMLGGLGHVAARRAGTTRAAAVGWAMVSAGLGGAVILLNVLLH